MPPSSFPLFPLALSFMTIGLTQQGLPVARMHM
jgi:hypothetical protein